MGCWHSKPCFQENLAVLLRRLLEPALLNESFEALEDVFQFRPILGDGL